MEKDVKYLSMFDTNYLDFYKDIMTAEYVSVLKKMEPAMINRKKRYNCCKTLHAKLYNNVMNARIKYFTPTMLSMLQHKYSTKKRGKPLRQKTNTF